jgi:hypothetical protein
MLCLNYMSFFCLQIILRYVTFTNRHWARVVSYGPFSLCVIHKEGLCPSNEDINGLMVTLLFQQISDMLCIKRPDQIRIDSHAHAFKCLYCAGMDLVTLPFA